MDRDTCNILLSQLFADAGITPEEFLALFEVQQVTEQEVEPLYDVDETGNPALHQDKLVNFFEHHAECVDAIMEQGGMEISHGKLADIKRYKKWLKELAITEVERLRQLQHHSGNTDNAARPRKKGLLDRLRSLFSFSIKDREDEHNAHLNARKSQQQNKHVRTNLREDDRRDRRRAKEEVQTKIKKRTKEHIDGVILADIEGDKKAFIDRLRSFLKKPDGNTESGKKKLITELQKELKDNLVDIGLDEKENVVIVIEEPVSKEKRKVHILDHMQDMAQAEIRTLQGRLEKLTGKQNPSVNMSANDLKAALREINLTAEGGEKLEKGEAVKPGTTPEKPEEEKDKSRQV